MADSAELNELCQAVFAQRPLILVSNRGPVEHQMTGDGRPEARRGSGSVVTAFSSLAQKFEFTWVASAMGEGDRVVSNNGQGPHLKSPLPGHKINLRYVVTPRRVYHKYYNILCNPLLWFLQHYMWNPPYNPNVDAAVHDAWETGYIPVNQAFADAVIEEARALEQAPIVIGHDYHLYLMPEFVRQGVPEAVIQHFIHIPWPTPQYWHMIPDYIIRRICESLCATDLLGFQTIGDVRCFLDTVEEFVPEVTVDRTNHTVARNGRTTSVKVYPISINVEEVQRIANSPRALDYETRLSADAGEFTIVRIDRAEPNKNIVRGFRAYELMLTRYPELKGKVKFLAFLVPSRTHIRQYQRYMDEIQQVIQQINNNHGTEDWQPIVPFIENNYTQAIAGMKLYDVLLVNTIIEGMNLVAKEGPVVNNRDGVLVLSQSSGVHQQLADGAISVSPTDIEGTMEALHQAVTMPAGDRKDRAARLVESVCREDINHWLYQQMHDISALL
ncbi:MAG: trehalose-6-phosphate synthase [Chloroflexi bacterium]|nr:trehalose-6-phosphate synthase [Chloroflexota bacterium]